MPGLGGDRKLVVKATDTPRQRWMIFWDDLGDTHISNSIFSATATFIAKLNTSLTILTIDPLCLR
jgi:hypothetical protein